MCLLGLDVGEKRIGVAKSDDLGWTAQALTVLTRKGGKHDLEVIASLVQEHQACGVVVGLPLDMHGGEGKAAQKMKRFMARLQEHLAVPVYPWDERLTTFQAEEILREAEVKPKRRKQVIDKLAAVLILKSYLEAHPLPPNHLEEKT